MTESVIRCDVISAGAAEGSLCLFDVLYVPMAGRAEPSGERPEAEMNRFKEQVTSLVRDLKEAVDSLESESLSAEADVIRAHISMLQDAMFHARVQQAIGRLRFAAESAVEHAIEGVAPKELSVLRARLRSVRISACRELAHACLEAQTAAEVRTMLGIRPQSAIEATSTLVGRGQAVDPVCKMIVKVEENPYSLVHKDHRYYFCSRPCTLQFQKESDREGSP